MKYKVINENGLNYRESPSINANVIGNLKKGYTISVSTIRTVSETQTTTGENVKICWGKIKINGKYYYCSLGDKYVKEIVNYGWKIGQCCECLAKNIVSKKLKHVSGNYFYDGRKVNCTSFVAMVLHMAGCNPQKKIIQHDGKNVPDLPHLTWYKVDRKYSSLPSSMKKEGCVYRYKSNIAVLHDKAIWSCNLSGQKYDQISDIKHTSGYNFNEHIDRVGVPREE